MRSWFFHKGETPLLRLRSALKKAKFRTAGTTDSGSDKILVWKDVPGQKAIAVGYINLQMGGACFCFDTKKRGDPLVKEVVGIAVGLQKKGVSTSPVDASLFPPHGDISQKDEAMAG